MTKSKQKKNRRLQKRIDVVINPSWELSTEFYHIARSDLKASQVLYDMGLYSQSVYHLQQCIEKALKSVGMSFKLIKSDELRKKVGHTPYKLISQVGNNYSKFLRHKDALSEMKLYSHKISLDILSNFFAESPALDKKPEKDSSDMIVDYFKEIAGLFNKGTIDLKNPGKEIMTEGDFDYPLLDMKYTEELYNKIPECLNCVDAYPVECKAATIHVIKKMSYQLFSLMPTNTSKKEITDEIHGYLNDTLTQDSMKQMLHQTILIICIWKYLNHLSIIVNKQEMITRYPDSNPKFQNTPYNPLTLFNEDYIFVKKLPELQYYSSIMLDEVKDLYLLNKKYTEIIT